MLNKRPFKALFTFIILIIFLSISINQAFASQVQFELKSGWNMVSFPYDSVTDMGDTSHINNVLFHYNSESGGYDFAFVNSPGGIKPGYGYWVKADQDATVTVTGDPVTDGTAPFTVKSGWNQFGIPYDDTPLWGTVPVSETPPLGKAGVNSVNDAISEGWFSSVIFQYNPVSLGYDFTFATGSLIQKTGYWLKSTHDCWLVFANPTGSVSGIISDAGNPVADVQVILTDTDPDAKNNRAVNLNTVTNAGGEYSFSEVPAGNIYYLQAVKLNYITFKGMLTASINLNILPSLRSSL